MTVNSALNVLLRRSLAPFGIRVVRVTTDKVRGLEPLLDLQYLVGKKRDPVIFDVGANEGETVQQFLKLFPHCRIMAFEPFEGCYKKLQKVFAGVKNVRIENVALGAHRGLSQLNVYTGSNMNSLLQMDDRPGNVLKDSFRKCGTANVQVETLDHFCSSNAFLSIDVLKVDTQGFDLNVLRGAAGLLKQGRIKTILLEVNFLPMYKDQASFVELHSFLSAFGYRFVDFYNQARHEGCTAWCDACYVASDTGMPPT